MSTLACDKVQKMKKVLLIILGILTVIGGMWCAATPGLTYLSMVWVIGFVMFFHAIEEMVTYSDRKALGFANGWNLCGSILAFICGLLIIISAKAEFLTGVALLYYLFFWLIFAGVFGIMAAFNLKKHTGSEIPAVATAAGKWWVGVIFGILMIIAGCLGFAHPLLAAISIGLIVGFEIIVTGVNLVIAGITMPSA